MKKIFLFSAVILAVLLLLPLSVIDIKVANGQVLQTGAAADKTSQNAETVKVLISQTGEITEMPVEDYIFGVVAGEMPAL